MCSLFRWTTLKSRHRVRLMWWTAKIIRRSTRLSGRRRWRSLGPLRTVYRRHSGSKFNREKGSLSAGQSHLKPVAVAKRCKLRANLWHDLLSCNIICIWKMIKRWLDECQSNLLTYWWTNKLTGWLIGCLTDWLRDWLIDRLIDTLTDWLINYLIDWLLYCLIDCMMDWLMGWLTVCLINWMTEDWKTA